MYKTKDEVAEILAEYFTICVAIVTEDSSNYQKHILTYQLSRKKVLELDKEINIPSWISNAANIPFLKSHVDLHVQSGNGSWSRRRNYLHSVMHSIMESYHAPSGPSFAKAMSEAMNSDQPSDLKPAHGGKLPPLPKEIRDFLQSSEEIEKNRIYSQPTHQLTSLSLHDQEARLGMSNTGSPELQMKKKVFIVHGHDELLMNQVHVFLTNEGFNPIILQNEANSGATILDKLEKNIDTVSYAVILYTACDEGKAKKEDALKPRARQNVVFEHGYLLSKLGREYVAALRGEGVEIPGDLQGLITIPTDNWQYRLQLELKKAFS
ncbi:nucleotide-binding protein [Pantoea endophytica]|uniref:Nucleotide-binding protein n=1 Tax=Pantoea sp. BJ2 TaxID=3141322 RepID=A0AAU7U4J0_9GAMM